MSRIRGLLGWSAHAQAVGWLKAWLRALRSGHARLAALATAALRRLGVVVRAVLGSTP